MLGNGNTKAILFDLYRFSLQLETTCLISSVGIGVEYPNIINSQNDHQKDTQKICLTKIQYKTISNDLSDGDSFAGKCMKFLVQSTEVLRVTCYVLRVTCYVLRVT